MVLEYFQNLGFLWSRPAEFFDKNYDVRGENKAFRFANITGILVSVELGVVEIFSGGSVMNVVLVTLVMLLGMPFFVNAWIYLWSGFMKLCAYMLGEVLPLEPVRQVVAYSVAGLAFLGLGYGLGKWLALAIFIFQIFGVEKSFAVFTVDGGDLCGPAFFPGRGADRVRDLHVQGV